MTITTIQQVSYNWFEWPNIISFLVVVAGLILMVVALLLEVRNHSKASTVFIVVGAVAAIAGLVWGIADEANSEVIYERVVHQVVDRTP